MMRTDAEMWVRDRLSSGPVPSALFTEEARAAGIGVEMLQSIRESFGLETFKEGWQGPVYLGFPKTTKDAWSDEIAAQELLLRVRNRPLEQQASYTLEQIVEWVSEHRRDRLRDLRVEEVPNGRALDMLLWAKENPDDFRTMYDSKLMRGRPVGRGGRGGKLVLPESGQRARHDALVDGLMKDRRTG